MARTGMADVITKLRRMMNAGTADYSVAGETYWTDDHIQTLLDDNHVRINHEQLAPMQEWVDGSIVYKQFLYPNYEAERNTGGSAVFRVTNSNGSVIGTANYSVNYDARRIVFTTDQEAELRYLTADAYDLNAAAAQGWSEKAAHYQASFDFATDNHDMKRSQLIQQAMAMSKLYQKKTAARTLRIKRLDTT